MKKSYALLVALALFFCVPLFSQNNKFWSPVNESLIRLTGERQITPQKFLTFSLNGTALRDMLFQAPHEKTTSVYKSEWIIALPVPDGTIQNFRVVESPLMAEELGSAFPDMKTFTVKGIDDPDAIGTLDWNVFGFHAMILSLRGDFFIDPFCVNNLTDYQAYYKTDFVKPVSQRATEGEVVFEGQRKPEPAAPGSEANKSTNTAASICVGANLRTYRLAVACTGEYAKAATSLSAPTVTQVLARIVTSVNRVNLVYQKEVSVRFVLVPTETLIIYVDPATDPFNGNGNGNVLINESQTVITNIIGSANFDIGHTFSTGGGGLANLAAVCSTNNKARGVTGNSYPVGDPYDIDYVAHEVGHQFDGDHTFNANTGSCNGNRNGSTSVEPGSGITIMAYAGICSPNDVATHSIANFHAISYDQIVNFTNSGTGNTCPVTTTTGNNPPIVAPMTGFVIPVSTPFILTGIATDPDGDKLYYSWEETDPGSGGGANWNSGGAPYFRSYAPDTAAFPGGPFSRLFPRRALALSGNFTLTIGEFLPATPQVLNFRLTARDNKAGGGGVCYANTTVTLDAGGPFTVTYPSPAGTVWMVNTLQTVTWDLGNTNQAPVNCDSVRILISYDAGLTFSVLVNSTPNDGAEGIIVPTLPTTTTTCRIKVESIGNIFYDTSNSNFTITTSALSTVGIKQISQNNPVGLNVWPNPFSSQLNFVVSNLNSKSSTMVRVVDVLGKTLMQQAYSNKSELKETLDLSSLSNGVYFIKVSNDNNQSVHRIVKD